MVAGGKDWNDVHEMGNADHQSVLVRGRRKGIELVEMWSTQRYGTKESGTDLHGICA